ncbi:MAG: hypothetical protein WAO78_14885 [Roseovarius sp.]
MAAINLTALAKKMFFQSETNGVLSNSSGLLALKVKMAQGAGFSG